MTKRVQCIAALLLFTFACGGTDAPSDANVTGTWVHASGAFRLQWQLTQTGTVVQGTSFVVDPSDSQYGSAGIHGVVKGSVSGASFTYTDSYSSTQVSGCSEVDSGTLSVGGGVMSGNNLEQNTCRSADSAPVSFQLSP